MNSAGHSDKSVNQSLKIGARILREDQAGVILPSYSKMREQIGHFRSDAKSRRDADESNDNPILMRYKQDFRTNYDNVISLLGERGSGKSSVLLTLKYHHTKDFADTDLIFPLIAPDQMSKASDTLGWLLSFLQEEMTTIDALLQADREKTDRWSQDTFCNKETKSELQKNYLDLQKAYLLRQDTYAAIVRRRDEGVYEHIQDSQKIVNCDRGLMEKFHTFVDLLLETKSQLLSKQGNHQEPMILIFFDDVDISSGRCMEVLETVRTFLSHPNVIVFVSGAYSVFLEAVTIHMLHDERVDSGSCDRDFAPQVGEAERSALVRRQERSREYLKKVFPPAFRYEMKNHLSEQEKADFAYYFDDKQEEEAPTFLDLLSGVRGSTGMTLGERFTETGTTVTDGDEDKGVQRSQIPVTYFRVFDHNPRGLISPYYFLYQRKDSAWTGTDVIRFMEVILHANSQLLDYQKRIKDIIRIEFDAGGKLLDKERTFIDYSLVHGDRMVILTKEESVFREMARQDLTLLLLADLLEKMLGLFEPRFAIADHVKAKQLAKLLNRIYGSKLFPQISQVRQLLSIHEKLTPLLSIVRRQMFDVTSDTHFLERKYIEKVSEDKGLHAFLKQSYGEDNSWLDEKISYIGQIGRTDQEIYDSIVGHIHLNTPFWDKEIYSEIVPDQELILRMNLEQINEAMTRISQQPIDPDKTITTIISGMDILSLFEQEYQIEQEINQVNEEITTLTGRIQILNQSRWLRHADSSVNDKKNSLLSKIEKRIKKNEQLLSKFKNIQDTEQLLFTYFNEENIGIDSFDIEMAISSNNDSNADLAENFLEHVDGMYITYFNPIVVLKEFLNIYQIKQFIKQESIDFIALIFNDPEELDHLSEAEQSSISNFFELTHELDLLKKLLPPAFTTNVNEVHDIKLEISEAQYKLEKLKDQKGDVFAEMEQYSKSLIASNNGPLNEALHDWYQTRTYKNRKKVLSEFASIYLNNENYQFYLSYKNLFDGNSAIENLSAQDTVRIWQGIAQNVEFLLTQRTQFYRSFNAQKEFWAEVLEGIDQENGKLIPSVSLYVKALYEIEMLRIKADEEALGSIAYFREEKRQLIETASKNHSTFDLYLKQKLVRS
ncbi:hypothetical protein [Paenibacillus sp. FJAT-26967]|uniref:hypothetical protein n=1 Tax=Paenibacillus sp. FJAT-26967 TaxID=1729690 RepID=UPI000838CF8F|nr:hypothetical protein [Paenibacillus sp. FJAT-26967]